MRGFAARLAIFLAGAAVLFAGASVLYEWRIRQTDDFIDQLERFNQPEVEPVVLFVGDSRIAMNVQAERLPPGYYNWSYPGENLRQLYLRVKYALEAKPSIRYLVIGLEDVTLSEARARDLDVSRQLLFADLDDLADIYPASPRFLLRAAVLHYLPLINAVQRRRVADVMLDDFVRLLTGAGPPQPTRLICGDFRFTGPSDWNKMEWTQQLVGAVANVGGLFGDDARDAPEMQRAFQRLLAMARRHHVEVIGVHSPLTRAYADAATRLERSTASSYFAAAPLHALLDFRLLFADRPDYFQDSDHLSDRGAATYTDFLVQQLRGLVHRNPEPTEKAQCDVKADAQPRSWPYNNILPDEPLRCLMEQRGCAHSRFAPPHEETAIWKAPDPAPGAEPATSTHLSAGESGRRGRSAPRRGIDRLRHRHQGPFPCSVG